MYSCWQVRGGSNTTLLILYAKVMKGQSFFWRSSKIISVTHVHINFERFCTKWWWGFRQGVILGVPTLHIKKTPRQMSHWWWLSKFWIWECTQRKHLYLRSSTKNLISFAYKVYKWGMINYIQISLILLTVSLREKITILIKGILNI